MNITTVAKSGVYSVDISAAILNMNGFIVMGLYQGTYNELNTTLPITTDIKQGRFNVNETLVAVKMVHSSQNVVKKMSFTALTPNTYYVIFYFCSVENPSLVSLSSNVKYVAVKTLQILTVDGNWESYIKIISLLLLALLI